MEWIEANKGWFLSGAGLFIISTTMSFLSVLVTLFIKSRSARRRRKILLIQKDLTKFSLPSTQASNTNVMDQVKVAYKGTEYENLCAYHLHLTNRGRPSISNQEIHFLLPLGSTIVDVFIEKSLETMAHTHESFRNEKAIGRILKFDRLEHNDQCSLTFLVDLKNIESIECSPRGPEDVEYIYSEGIENYEVEKLSFLIAAFVFSGSFPFFGSFIQALIVLAIIPLAAEIYRKHKEKDLSSEAFSITSSNISVDKNGELTINMGSSR